MFLNNLANIDYKIKNIKRKLLTPAGHRLLHQGKN